MTNPVQPLNPAGANDPVTPADSPSSPADYAAVTPHGRGPAPYSIQQASDLAAVAAQMDAASAVSGRQAQAKTLMDSPMGFGSAGFDVDAGMTCGWPANVEPPDRDAGD